VAQSGHQRRLSKGEGKKDKRKEKRKKQNRMEMQRMKGDLQFVEKKERTKRNEDKQRVNLQLNKRKATSDSKSARVASLTADAVCGKKPQS
jgi:hypothetical protein